MNRRTPKRQSINTNSGYSPITLHTSPASQSPQKNLTGPPRIIRDIIADLYNNIQRWNAIHIQGCAIVKQIASLKAEEPRTYSSQLEEYVSELHNAVLNLKVNRDTFDMLIKQGEAFSKLTHVSDPVFFTLSSSSISVLVSEICEAYKKEYEIKHQLTLYPLLICYEPYESNSFQAKQFILENIAHSKNKNEVMFFAAYWTHQLNIDNKVTFKLESLLLESGHRPIQ